MKTSRSRATYRFLIASLLCVLGACGDDDERSTQQVPTATLAPATPTPTPVQTGSAGASMAAIDLTDTAGFHDMAEELAAADSLSRMGPALAVMAAQDVIDSQGFHAMEEEIVAAQTFDDVSPRNLGRVEKALTVSMAAPFPAAVTAELEIFQADAQALIDALVAADLPAAQVAVDAIHSSQHALSNAAFQWLATESGDPPDDVVAAVGVMAAQDIIDSQGFHDMEEEIAAAQTFDDVSPRNLGRVEKALNVSMVGVFPAAVGMQLAAFQSDAAALIDALSAADLPAAQSAADAVHASQHALSNAAYDWLDTQGGETGIGLLLVLGVMAAQDIIDSQGFHDMEEEIAAAQTFDDVNPRNLGRVEKALTVSMAAPFAEAVAAELEIFQTDAQVLIDALVAGDLSAAQVAVDAIHSSQHALSNAAYAWLATQDGGQLMESLINSRFLGTVEKILAVAGATPWDADVEEEIDIVVADLEALRAALETGDTSAAAQASDAVHGSQHALSHAVYAWLQTQERTSSDAGAVMAAQDIIDSQGFHAMEEEITAAQSIDEVSPRNLGKVENALTTSRAVAWPAELAAAAELFEADAEALIAALNADDLAGAQVAVDAIHASQHALSNAAYDWLQTQERRVSDPGAVMAAQDIIDSQGFHAMEEEIVAAQTFDEVSPRNLGKVESALTASRAVAWPAELAAAAELFEADAEVLIAALSAGELAAAQVAVDAIHASQHGLSNATFVWLGQMGPPDGPSPTPSSTRPVASPSPTATPTPTVPPSPPPTPATGISYADDVHPIWTARGCTDCHRGNDAPGGMVLSGDPASTHQMIVPERVNLADPPNSRILLKPLATTAGGISHGGGNRFADTSDPDYQTILQWIIEGAQNN